MCSVRNRGMATLVMSRMKSWQPLHSKEMTRHMLF